METSVLLKGLTMPNIKSSKIAGLSRTIFALFTWPTIGRLQEHKCIDRRLAPGRWLTELS